MNDSDIIGTLLTIKKNRKSSKLIILGTLLLVLIGCIFVFTFLKSKTDSDTSSKISEYQKQVNFDLYYPVNLPQNLSVVTKSISITEQVFLYQVVDSITGKSISVSIQPKQDITDSLYKGDNEFISQMGRAIILDFPGRTTAAVFADKSWALLNANDQIPRQTMEQIINSLRQVQP